MPTLNEPNQQAYDVLRILQEELHKALNSGRTGRIRFDDLAFAGARFHDWNNGPCVSYKATLSKIGAKP